MRPFNIPSAVVQSPIDRQVCQSGEGSRNSSRGRRLSFERVPRCNTLWLVAGALLACSRLRRRRRSTLLLEGNRFEFAISVESRDFAHEWRDKKSVAYFHKNGENNKLITMCNITNQPVALVRPCEGRSYVCATRLNEISFDGSAVAEWRISTGSTIKGGCNRSTRGNGYEEIGCCVWYLDSHTARSNWISLAVEPVTRGFYPTERSKSIILLTWNALSKTYIKLSKLALRN